MLRKLTEEEKSLIKKAKARANESLEFRRKALREQYRKQRAIRILEEIDRIQNVTGSPVELHVLDESMIINYDLVRKFTGKLKGYELRVRNGILCIVEQGKKRDIWVELYSLPDYQIEVLTGLPVIEIDEFGNEL